MKSYIDYLESYLFENEETCYSRLTLLKKLAFKYFPDEFAKSSTNQQNEGGSLVGKIYIEKAMENIEYNTVVQISKLLKINTGVVESIDS